MQIATNPLQFFLCLLTNRQVFATVSPQHPVLTHVVSAGLFNRQISVKQYILAEKPALRTRRTLVRLTYGAHFLPKLHYFMKIFKGKV